MAGKVFGWICVCMLYMFIPDANAQGMKTDIDLLRGTGFEKPEYGTRKVKFLLSGSRNALVRYNPVSLTLGGLMYVYQKGISPQLATGCSYEVSCSNFSKRSIGEYGFVKGVAMSADRLMRCNPMAVKDLGELDFTEDGKIKDGMDNYRLRK